MLVIQCPGFDWQGKSVWLQRRNRELGCYQPLGWVRGEVVHSQLLHERLVYELLVYEWEVYEKLV